MIQVVYHRPGFIISPLTTHLSVSCDKSFSKAEGLVDVIKCKVAHDEVLVRSMPSTRMRRSGRAKGELE